MEAPQAIKDRRSDTTDRLKRRLADEIAARRRALGLHQREVAALAHMPRCEIAHIENRRLERFTLDRLCWVLCALGCEVAITVSKSPSGPT